MHGITPSGYSAAMLHLAVLNRLRCLLARVIIGGHHGSTTLSVSEAPGAPKGGRPGGSGPVDGTAR